MPSNKRVYDFRVTLLNTKPAIWRRIVVPEDYSFWDLHVAIQDSMGWLDYHLHAFRFNSGRLTHEIGIPDDAGFSHVVTLPGWEIPIKKYFDVGKSCIYEYDFGDGWTHEVLLQGIVLAEEKTKYPVCLDGAMACPPEDCGGVPGYYRILEVLKDPKHEEYKELRAWVDRSFNPKSFEPSKVKFANPTKRWKIAFSDGR